VSLWLQSPMKSAASICGLLLLVSAAYSNHFRNGFHFDDAHTIINNPYIRNLHNLPLFFKDASTFSTLPANRTYRPLVSASLALDFALGHGLNPVYFHASTFFWFLLQLVLVSALFLKICDAGRPDPRNRWIALFAAALYGVHPAIAETVNYIIQRGDLYSTLGVVAALVCYVYAPKQRKFGFYLLPFAAALLSKPPALVFPVILFIYVWLFEEERFSRVLYRCVPAIVVVAGLGWFMTAMTPSTYVPGSASAYGYRITQPFVALRYFQTFFIPDHLTADTDLTPLNTVLDGHAWLGFLFLMAVIAVAVWTSRRRQWRPSAFGLWWFLIALAPTAILPLAEVENDHRMFFPFVGLALAVCWPVGQLIMSRPLRSWMRVAVATAGVAVLCGYAWGTMQRHEVWRTDESLWRDVSIKSPKNGRGLMNYGLALMEKGDLSGARDAFNRAAIYSPNYYFLEINQGIVSGALHEDVAAEQHFDRAIALAPSQADSHYYFARWLDERYRWPEAVEQLRLAIAANPDYIAARYLQMESAFNRGDLATVNQEADATLQRFPSDPTALGYRARAVDSNPSAPSRPMTAEDYLNLSLSYNRAKKFPESIAAAEEALKLKPDYAEAHNNIAAAYEEMQKWDLAIGEARKALKIRPDFQLARNNLEWSITQKQKASGR
jgi:tetratricopeptide (TPR) repeat protein